MVQKLPSLMLEARRVAATVAQGIHGRRRAGTGETFWQFRNFEAGDAAGLIDWRRSAGSSHLFVREREWEAAHTVWIWPDLSPSMQFMSHLSNTAKAERALVLAFALASLLADGGERVGLPGALEPKARRNISAPMLDAIAARSHGFNGLPSDTVTVSRHSEIIIFSDFLSPPDKLRETFATLAQQGARGHLVQILDPAEETLPYSGRVEFYDHDDGHRYIAERAESLRDAYKTQMAAHKAALALIARDLGWTTFLHHTDRPAVEALLPLHMALSGLEKAYRAKGTVKAQIAGRSLS